jgi:hypothetical protein
LNRRDLFAIAILFALPTLIFSDVLFGDATLAHRDLPSYHYPLKRVVREAMLSGELPMWNRSIAGGQPLAANPAYELFYPGQWPILIGPFPYGFVLHILLHLYIAALGMFLLLRALALSRPAAMFGAVSFSLGGIFVGSISVLPTFFVWSLAPLVAWGILRFVQEPAARRFAVAALCAGVQLLIVEPIALAQVWFLYALGVAILTFRTRHSLVRACVALAAIGFAAFLIAAVQAIPAMDHVGDSARARGLGFSTVADFSLSPLRVLEILTPAVYQTALKSRPAFWGDRILPHNGARPYFDSIYPGLAVVILALAGVIARYPGAITASIVMLGSFALALGDGTPLLRLLYDIGVARALRYPEKFMFMGVAALVVFAAFVCDRLLSGEPRIRRAVLAAASVLVIVRAVPVVWSLRPGYVEWFARFWRLDPERAQLALAARQAWIIALILSVVLLAIILVRDRLRPAVFAGALLVTVAVDVATHANGIVPRVPSLFYSPPPVAQMIIADGANAAVFHRGHWNPDDPDRLRYQALSRAWLNRNALEPLMAPAWSLRSVLELDWDETFLLPTHDALDTMMALGNSGFERWWEPFAVISSAGYILEYRPFNEALSEVKGDPFLLRAANVLRYPAQPRYFVARRVVQAEDNRAAVEFLRANPRPFLTAMTPFPAPPALAGGTVTRFVETVNEATIDVEAAGQALLVMTVTRHKYWSAWVDGRKAELVPVNIAYQGVIVPRGSHRVTMRYRNPVVIWSGVVSLVTLLALTTILIRPRLRPRSGS